MATKSKKPAAKSSGQTQKPITESAVTVTGYTVTYPTGANLRQAPSLTAPIVRILPRGVHVEQTGENAPAGWLAVEGGYLMRELVE